MSLGEDCKIYENENGMDPCLKVPLVLFSFYRGKKDSLLGQIFRCQAKQGACILEQLNPKFALCLTGLNLK